jgi:hypothetical protein
MGLVSSMPETHKHGGAMSDVIETIAICALIGWICWLIYKT